MDHHDTGLEHDAEKVSIFFEIGLDLGFLIMFVWLDVSDVLVVFWV